LAAHTCRAELRCATPNRASGAVDETFIPRQPGAGR
jgi:hypothetical protein